MFVVARPYAHPLASHPRHSPYEPVYSGSYSPLGSTCSAEPYVARRHYDELVRQRARAAAIRAQQRREYEEQLAIQVAEEAYYHQHIARLRAQEELRRQLAREERLRQIIEQRRVERERRTSALKAFAAQQAVIAAIEHTLVDDSTHVDFTRTAAPLQEQVQATPAKKETTVKDALLYRAQEERDPEVLLAVNSLLQRLVSGPSSASSFESVLAAPMEKNTAADSPMEEIVIPVETLTPATEVTTTQAVTPASPASSTSSIYQNSLDALNDISTSLNDLTLTFTLPKADFLRPSSSTDARPSSPSTNLSYAPANQPIHAYEAALSKLLDRLDAVESDGDEEIRAKRKELVMQIEEKLRELDEAIELQRREHENSTLRSSSPVMDTEVEIPIGVSSEMTLDIPVTGADVEEASIEITQDTAIEQDCDDVVVPPLGITVEEDGTLSAASEQMADEKPETVEHVHIDRSQDPADDNTISTPALIAESTQPVDVPMEDEEATVEAIFASPLPGPDVTFDLLPDTEADTKSDVQTELSSDVLQSKTAAVHDGREVEEWLAVDA